MPEEKNFFTGLFDFSFSHSLLRRLVKLLYVIAIVFGGITVVACVVLGYQQSPAQGLINLVAGIVALFVGVLVVRVLLELALAILRIAEGIERATHPGT
jgi:predicted neutral ceramidase superfamily lipid hydrolase